MAKTTYRKGTTDIGTFMFPRLFETEKFEGKDTGKFTVSFLPETDADRHALSSAIDEEWQKYKESDEGKKHKYKYDYANGVTSYSGTRGRIAYELMPYYMNDKNYGVSLRLTGVQIIELKDTGSVSASSLGFEACEGYTHTAPIPFDDVPATEEEDF